MARSNTGRWLETAIQAAAARYHQDGILTLEKADPPTRVIYKPGGNPFVIQLSNPFLDFVGVLHNCGRAIIIEAKSTAHPRLPFNSDAGITVAQYNALQRWHNAGAICFVLWGREAEKEVRLVRLETIWREAGAGRKSVKWHNANPLPAFCEFASFCKFRANELALASRVMQSPSHDDDSAGANRA